MWMDYRVAISVFQALDESSAGAIAGFAMAPAGCGGGKANPHMLAYWPLQAAMIARSSSVICVRLASGMY